MKKTTKKRKSQDMKDMKEIAERLEYLRSELRAERISYKEIAERLEYLRSELRAERISYGELFELQCLVDLLRAAGVPEFPEARRKKVGKKIVRKKATKRAKR